MGLHLITGSANAGLTEAVHDQVRSCVRSGSGALLLLPSAPDVSRATEKLSVDAAIGIKISTFDDHLSALWSLVGDGRKIATPVQRLIMLEESVRTHAPRAVSASFTSPGMSRALSVTVQRVAECRSPDLHGRRAAGVGEDLLSCAATYSALLKRAGLIECAEAHRLACERSNPAAMYGLVAVDHFSGLTAAQEAYIHRVAAHGDVVIALVYVAGLPATAAAHELVERLRPLGKMSELPPREDSRRSAELACIERSLGTVGPCVTDAGGALVLSEAWGSASECARIVREVQDAIDYGLAGDQIAVVVRDAGARLSELRAAFREAQLDVDFDARVPFIRTGIGRTLMHLLELVGPDTTYAGLMDVLRSPFSPAPDDALDAMDAHLRGTRAVDARSAESWLRTHAPTSASFIAEARRACRTRTGEVAERRWYELLNGMLCRAYGSPVAAVDSDLLLDAAAVRTFIEAVHGIADQGQGDSTCVILASALRESQVTLTSERRAGHVQVMGAERVRGSSYGCVIIGGLNAGEFPRRIGDDVLSSPGIMRAFARAGIDAAPRADLDAERLLFYLAATRAEQRLVLSWRSHDEEGRAIQPSVLLAEVLDLYRDPSSGRFFNGSPPLQALGLAGWADDAAGPCTERRTLRGQALASGGRGLPASRDIERRARRSSPSRSHAVRRAVAEREAFSASEIETYLQCRYRWYVQRLVKPRALDGQLDKAAEGRLAHEIMLRFYEAFTGTGDRARVTPDLLADARRVHGEVCQKLGEMRAASTAEAAGLRVVVRKTWRLLEADALLLPGMLPVYHEWSFGMAGEDPPEEFGSFALAGRADRIDATEHSLVVTDYKLGGIDAGRGVGRFEMEGLVQLPLYAAVAARRLGLSVDGGLYRSMAGGKPRGFVSSTLGCSDFVRTDVVPTDQITAVLESAVARAADAVEGMRSGDIHAEPRGGSCPSYCPARAFCMDWRPGRD